LQSTKEELETAKEELQSVNEELQTVNDELQTRNSDLMQATNDLANLLSSVSIPIVMVGPDLRIRRFTPSAERALAIRSTDVGRPITQLHPNLDLPDLGRLIGDVVENVKVIETEVRDGSGQWHLLTVRPYRTADNRLDGAVLALTDIHAQKMDQARLQEAADYARSIVETALLVLDHRLAVDTANGAFYEMFHVTADQIEGKRLYELGNGQWDIPALRDALEHVLPARERLVDFEVTHEFPSIGRRTMLLSASQISPAEEGTPTLILLAIEDVTDRRRAEAEREALARERSFGGSEASVPNREVRSRRWR
jgi:two-component system CheB/CheR fusion protein